MSELLPTPSARDGRGSYGKPRDNIDCAIEVGRTKTSSFSLEASRAKNFPMQENEKERQELDISGQKCYRLYTKLNPTLSLQKMLEALLVGNRGWHSKQCVLTWKSVVTPYNRLLFQLAAKVRLTDENVSGLLLRTPEAGDNLDRKLAMNSRGELKLSGQIKVMSAVVKDWRKELLLTPTASESEMNLEKFKKRMEKYPNGTTMPNLSTQMSSGVGTGVKLRLQPAMTEWMMGYPDGWTELPYAENKPTPSQPANTAKND